MTDEELDDFLNNRRMSDEELLDRSIALARDQYQLLLAFHHRHGGSPVFEDLCCRAVANAETTAVLAEAERREASREQD